MGWTNKDVLPGLADVYCENVIIQIAIIVGAGIAGFGSILPGASIPPPESQLVFISHRRDVLVMITYRIGITAIVVAHFYGGTKGQVRLHHAGLICLKLKTIPNRYKAGQARRECRPQNHRRRLWEDIGWKRDMPHHADWISIVQLGGGTWGELD
jgi:hypothetical protein